MSYYVYLGPLGEVVRHGASFIASKDGFLVGEYNTFREALESLEWKGRAKALGDQIFSASRIGAVYEGTKRKVMRQFYR